MLSTKVRSIGASTFFFFVVGELVADTTVYTQTFSANAGINDPDYIVTNGSVTIASTGNVAFVAGTRIRLTTGFHASRNGIFQAQVLRHPPSPKVDADGDGIPDDVEAVLGTQINPSKPPQSDTSNSVNMNVHAPRKI